MLPVIPVLAAYRLLSAWQKSLQLLVPLRTLRPRFRCLPIAEPLRLFLSQLFLRYATDLMDEGCVVLCCRMT